MAFDSNPMAVHHGEGYGELQVIGSPAFTMSEASNGDGDNKMFASSAATAFNLDTDVKSPHQLLGIELISGAGSNQNDDIRWIRAGRIPNDAHTAGQDGTDANTAKINYWVSTLEVALRLGRDSDGNLMVGSSDLSALGLGNFVINIHKVR